MLMSKPATPKQRQQKPANIQGSELPTLMGCVCYADSWNLTGIGKVGIYKIGSSALGEVSLQESMLTSYGQVYAGSKYFATQPEIYNGWVVDMKYNIYDTRDWSMSTIDGNYNFVARAMAFDPMSRRAYAITYNDYTYTYSLSVMDMETYAFKEIKQLGNEDWSALMCNGQGEVYGIKKNGELVKFNKSTGEESVIGQTGIGSAKMTAGTIDAETGRCLYIHYTGYSSDLYEINLETAQPTYLYAIPENAQILSLFVPEESIAEAAPGKAGVLEANFDGESMTGKFSFLLPSVTNAGTPLSGELNYTVALNGTTITEGSGEAGSDVTCDVTVEASGEYTFSVTVSNAEGAGEPAVLNRWVGYNVPNAPKSVSLTNEDGMLKLTWTPVSLGDDREATYTVVSYPDGTVVADNLAANEYICELPVSEELLRTSFGVKAINGDCRSAETRSNSYLSGYLTLPFSEDFEEADSFDLITPVDANGDNRTWQYQFFSEGRILINYSLSMPHDDWAVLHPVKMEGGKLYKIGCDARGTGIYYTEKFEMAVAKGKDVDSLTAGEVIIPATEISGEDYETYEGSFVPEEDGVYYVALHALSDTYQNILYVDNLYIMKGVSTLAPGEATALSVTPDPSGALSATISFKAPVLNMAGDALTELTHAVIERDGVEIGTVEGTTPGERLTFTDNNATNGINNYTVACYNSYGRGFETSMPAYVGLREPAAAENVRITYGSNTGEAKVTWEAPTTDLAGHDITTSELTYTVMRTVNGGNPVEVASGLTETTYTDQATDAAGDQVFANYIIKAVGIGGESDGAISNIYPFGRPESVPARESFGGRVTDYEWGAEAPYESFVSWDIYPSAELPFESYDGGSVAAAYSPYLSDDNSATLVSSLFDLTGLDTPTLTYYLYDYSDTANSLRIFVDNGETRTEAGAATFGEKEFDWKRESVDLSAFKGETVCIEFVADVVDFNILAIDNMRIGNDVEHNLAALSLTVPEEAEPNETFAVTALYENAGKKKAEGYTVSLLCDGETIATADGETVEPEAITTVTFNVTLNVTSPEKPVLQAVVNYNADETAADNATEEKSVKLHKSTLPAPENLTAAQNESAVELSWDAPDLANMALTPSRDDLESYVPFSTGLPTSPIEDDNIGEWTMYDVDGLPTYTGTFDYDGVGEPMAFVVYNSHMQEDNVFATHSGQQMFLSLASKPENGQGNDDWLVSPLLAGCSQTISFYAKSIDTYGVDTFEVLYSTTGKEIADFTSISTQESTGEWKEYSFQLPEGATYFAVRCISYDMYAFLLDDFRMITAKDAVSDLEIIGYNVYCNGKRVNDELIEATSYIHMPDATEDTTYRYNVACVFNHGESAPSETAEVDFIQTGIEEAAATSAILVRAGEGEIMISGLAGERVSIADTAGRIVYTGQPEDSVRVAAASGVYVVKAGNKTVKVIVK